MSDAIAQQSVADARRERRNASRRVSIDMRYRASRRQREIEREVRATLIRQGRTVGICEDVEIGSLASCAVQIEYLRGGQSRGALIDVEQLTRLLNTQSRLITALGLRPQVMEPPPNLSAYLAGKRPAS